MNCPACAATMQPVTTGGVTVDVCITSCGGIWFDHQELQRMDEPHETEGELLLALDVGKLAVDEAQRRDCPVCTEVVTMRRYYSVLRMAEVDECPACGGFFLDRGELEEVRSENSGSANRTGAKKLILAASSEDLAVQYSLAREQTSRWSDLCRVLAFPVKWR